MLVRESGANISGMYRNSRRKPGDKLQLIGTLRRVIILILTTHTDTLKKTEISLYNETILSLARVISNFTLHCEKMISFQSIKPELVSVLDDAPTLRL